MVPVCRVDHEVKDGAVVPEVEMTAEVVGTHIGLHPCHPARRLAEIDLRAFQRLSGYVGDHHIAIPAPQQLGSQSRCATTHVKYRGVQGQAGLSDQRQ